MSDEQQNEDGVDNAFDEAEQLPISPLRVRHNFLVKYENIHLFVIFHVAIMFLGICGAGSFCGQGDPSDVIRTRLWL